MQILHQGQARLDAGTKKIYSPKSCEWELTKMGIDLKQMIQNAGGYSSVAKRMGLTKQVVWSWANVLHRVPAEQVMDLEAAIGIPRHLIRPDIYPKNRELSS